MKPLKHALALGAVAGTLVLSGCVDPLNWGSVFAPKPGGNTPQPSATAPVTPAASPSPSAPSETPSPSPSPSASALVVGKAAGSMKLYANEVSNRFSGTCSIGETITIDVGDHANDFYGTVDVSVVLDAGATAASSMVAKFGEDSEGITRQITYDGAAPAKGTSAKVTKAGQRYQVSGSGLATETRNGKDSTRLIPYSLDLTCTVG